MKFNLPETKAAHHTAVNCLLTPGGDILYIGSEVNYTLGFVPEELTGKSFTSLLHPDDRDFLSSCFPLKNEIRKAVRVKTRAGKYVVAELNPEQSRDSSGRIHSLSVPLRFINTGLLISDDNKTCTEKVPSPQAPESTNAFGEGGEGRADFFPDSTEGNLQGKRFDVGYYKRALNAFSIIAVTDRKGVITYVNENFCRISQYSSYELTGNTHKLINSGFHPPSFFAEMWNTIRAGGVWKGEICNRAKNGSLYWVSTTIVPFLDGQNQPVQFLAIRQDITEKKRAEALLLESENLYRSLFENHPELVFVTNSQGVILRSNKNPLAVKISPEKDFTGKNFLHFLSEAGRRLVSSRLPDLLSGHTVQLEALLEKAVRPFTGLITVVPFEKEGLITGFFIKVRNITDRIKAEDALRLSNERYQLATKATQDAVLDWDLSANMIYLGDGYNTLFGHNFPSSISVDHWIKFVHPDDSKNVVEALFERISNNTNWSIEYRYRCADGTYKFIRDRACVIHNKYNRAIRVTGAMSDITEHKTSEELLKGFNAELEAKVSEKTSILEEALHRMEQEMKARAEADKILQQSVKEKEVLLKEIHHRVKNNMAVISGLLSLQARQAKQEEVKELFKDSQSRIKSMALIHEHLYQHKNLSGINFKEYVQELTEGIARSFNNGNKEVQIVVSGQDLELDIITAVPCGLILNELITNSYKYAFGEKKSGKIKVLFRKEAEQFFLEIADNGSGIPSGLNLSNPKSLGLKLVNNLVKQLGGTLKSENRSGSVFTILFPAKI